MKLKIRGLGARAFLSKEICPLCKTTTLSFVSYETMSSSGDSEIKICGPEHPLCRFIYCSVCKTIFDIPKKVKQKLKKFIKE